MTDQLNVKVGDKVAILSRKLDVHEPTVLALVTKVTPKRITTNIYTFDLEGHGVAGLSRGKRLSNNPVHIAMLQAKIDARNAESAKRQKEEAEREARKTYQLATQIVASWSKDPVADLELLGEEYLQRILDDIAKAKESLNA